jgi:hypothetical protein
VPEWKNWIGTTGIFIVLTISSCSSSTPTQNEFVHWYMMVPPTGDPTASLSYWTRTGVGFRDFMSKDDCESAIDKQREFVRLEGAPSSANYTDVSLAQCVSEDDPRLKTN